ncbi:MAG: hypothetical protein HC853_03540, partial [Anaerolineae bacterium]|nr:hypothetical protein [Anaerolineae bacterium]
MPLAPAATFFETFRATAERTPENAFPGSRSQWDARYHPHGYEITYRRAADSIAALRTAYGGR